MDDSKSIIWTKNESISGGKIGHYRGVEVTKTSSAYWVCWSEHVDWAAPHSKMSQPLRSAAEAKRMIERFLGYEAQDKTMIVRRFDNELNKQLWKERGYSRRHHLTLVHSA